MSKKVAKRRVMVAMSGGVDSSLTAALLQEEGYDIVGITMRLWHTKEDTAMAEERGRGCCDLSAVDDARKVAGDLGIPYYVLNFEKPFYEKVVRYFIEEYRRGRTPNPCIACNRYMKFDLLLKKARELEADYIATGHYARVEYDSESGRYVLLKSADVKKDQTYALYHMTQEQLRHTLFPLGRFRKEETRNMAAALGLKVADKPDSQEICFIPDDNYKRFLDSELPEGIKPGPIYDTRGKVIGTHQGIPFYTIGQRKGLGLAMGKPVYVVEINPQNNSIVVGSKEETLSPGLLADDLNFILYSELKEPIEVAVKIRYNASEKQATLYPPKEGVAKVVFHSPIGAVTPGQSVAFYQGEKVVGGGTIQKTI